MEVNTPVLVTYEVTSQKKAALFWFPIASILLLSIALALPHTAEYAFWLLKENHPVEVATFLILSLAGGRALFVAYRSAQENEAWKWRVLYSALGLGMLLVAMEEIAWGQQFLKFPTPTAWNAINKQGETTLHNVGPLQGRTEIFRLAVGLAGLFGGPILKGLGWGRLVPSEYLRMFFLVIAIHAGIDVVTDLVPVGEAVDFVVGRGSEYIECLIAVAAWYYVEALSMKEYHIKF